MHEVNINKEQSDLLRVTLDLLEIVCKFVENHDGSVTKNYSLEQREKITLDFLNEFTAEFSRLMLTPKADGQYGSDFSKHLDPFNLCHSNTDRN